MDAVALTRETLEFAHTMIELRIDAADEGTFFVAQPGSGVLSAAAIYGDTVIGEDHFVAARLGEPLVFEAWRQRLGFEPSAELRPDWAATLTCALVIIRDYAGAVYARSDAFLAALGQAEAATVVQNWEVIREEGKVRYAERQVSLLFGLMDNVTFHTMEHSGEIAVVSNLGRSARM